MLLVIFLSLLPLSPFEMNEYDYALLYTDLGQDWACEFKIWILSAILLPSVVLL